MLRATAGFQVLAVLGVTRRSLGPGLLCLVVSELGLGQAGAFPDAWGAQPSIIQQLWRPCSELKGSVSRWGLAQGGHKGPLFSHPGDPGSAVAAGLSGSS